jgi:hypothetical protein
VSVIEQHIKIKRLTIQQETIVTVVQKYEAFESTGALIDLS